MEVALAKGPLCVLAGFVLGMATATLFLSAPESQTAELDNLPEPYYTVLWENDDIRLVEHRLEAGQSEPMHYHPKACVKERKSPTRSPRSSS